VDALRLVVDLEGPFRGAARIERVRGTSDLRNFFRHAYGGGWALVGDAGCHKDPILGQGISDAFRSAEWLADAVQVGLSGARPLNEALEEYQRSRDEKLTPMYELSCSHAMLEPPSPETLALYQALRTNPPPNGTGSSVLLAALFPLPNIMQPIICSGSSTVPLREGQRQRAIGRKNNAAASQSATSPMAQIASTIFSPPFCSLRRPRDIGRPWPKPEAG
jgi:hypothetical protein